MDTQNEKLIQEIKKMRKEMGFAPYPENYLESKETKELNSIYVAHGELKPYYHPDHKENKAKLIINNKSWIVGVIIFAFLFFGLLFFFHQNPKEIINEPKNIIINNEYSFYDNFSIKYGFRENKTVFIIRNDELQIETMNITIDKTTKNYSLLIGKVPSKMKKEIGFIIEDYLCDDKQHEIGFLINNASKNFFFNNTCFNK